MIVVIRAGADPAGQARLIARLQEAGLGVRVTAAEGRAVLELSGDAERAEPVLLENREIIEAVRHASESFRLCGRREHPADTVVEAGGVRIGGGHFCLIAGPCAVESKEQVVAAARAVKAAGADMLRGGAFKPRTSPYGFQGLGREGLALLKLAKAETGLPVVSEIMSPAELPLFEDVDVLQVGARNMQNYDLLRELGRTDKPVLLKRGLAATLRELLLSTEYIMAGGNENVILCERGIRTFGDYLRNTLDLSAVPMLHELSHLPVVVDPSHGTGLARMVPPMALAAAACGADGLLIEVHGDPAHALSDGAQALRPEEFAALAGRVRMLREVIGRP